MANDEENTEDRVRELKIDVSAYTAKKEGIPHRFYISKHLFRYKAPNFRKTFVRLQDTAVNDFNFTTFHSFVEWLDDVPLNEIPYHRIRWGRLMPAIKLYLLGENFDVPKLCADVLPVIKEFVEKHALEVTTSNTVTRRVLSDASGHEEIRYIYDRTEFDSKLREIFVRHFCAIGLEKWATAAALCKYPKEFLVDLVRFGTTLKGHSLGLKHAEELLKQLHREDEGYDEVNGEQHENTDNSEPDTPGGLPTPPRKRRCKASNSDD